jgi:hypothetical protein
MRLAERLPSHRKMEPFATKGDGTLGVVSLEPSTTIWVRVHGLCAHLTVTALETIDR